MLHYLGRRKDALITKHMVKFQMVLKSWVYSNCAMVFSSKGGTNNIHKEIASIVYTLYLVQELEVVA